MSVNSPTGAKALGDCGEGGLDMDAGAENQPDDTLPHWRRHLAGIEHIPSLLPDLAAGTGGSVSRALDAGQIAALTGHGVTPLMVVSALLDIVLARICASREMLTILRDPEPLILYSQIDPDEAFARHLNRQAALVAEAQAHPAPLDQVALATGVIPNFALTHEGLAGEADEITFRLGAGRIEAQYPGDLYSPARIEATLDDLARALDRASADPSCNIGALLPPPAPLVVPVPDEIPQGRVFDPVLRQAEATPDRIALVGAEETLSYRQLDAASAALGRRLIAAGMGPGRRIAILAERGPRLVVSMLAVLRIGATMVPLDSEYPEARLELLVGVARPDAVLLPRRMPAPWADATPVLHADDPDDPQDIPDAALAAGDPDAPAYILFTSGSTGTPKGVATTHRPALNFLRWQRETFGIGPEDRFTNLMGVAHDMMIRDIFAPLSVGARLIIPHQSDIFAPGRLLDWVARQEPTVMHLTPAMGSLILAADGGRTRLAARLMFFGGDRLLPDLARRLADLAPGVQIVNFYGATETPQAAAFHVADPRAGWRVYPVGRGITNVALRVVDPATHHPMPPGAPGEIAVLTPFLSLGYVGPDGIRPHAQPGLYFTGDMGFALPSGEIVFTGRADDQVSIRGFRVELQDVARALKDHPRVHAAQVLVEGENPQRLIGFAETDATEDELIAWMEAELPGYMVPSRILPVARIPLLPNGKIDRQALLALPRRGVTEAPVTEREARLVDIWSGLLGADRVGRDSSFASLRGDSLTYVQVYLATETEIGQLPDGWETMPIRRLAETETQPAGAFRWIDTPIMVRAIAIVMIVFGHLGGLHYPGGATGALFLVTGFLIARLQLPEVVRTRSAAPFASLFVRVLVPTFIIAAAAYFGQLALGEPVKLASLLLYEDFVDASDMQAAVAAGHTVHLWYVSAILHILLAVTLYVWAMLRIRPDISVRALAFWLFLLALPLRFALPYVVDPALTTQPMRAFDLATVMPTTHLATFALGICIALMEKPAEKLAMLAMLAIYALASQMIFPEGGAVILIFGAMMLYLHRILVPAGLRRIVLTLSGGSLFIYLTHRYFAKLAGGVSPVEIWPPALAMIGLVGGILVWRGWQRVSPFFERVETRLLRRWGMID